MIIKGLEILKCLYYKVKYFTNIKIKLAIFRIPISTEIQLAKSCNALIEKIAINKNTSIRVRENATLILKKGTSINNGTVITCRDKIVIGNDVLIGPNVMIFDHDHNYKTKNVKNEFLTDSIIIEDNVWIGANSIILKGTHIGKNSVIAAGSVIKGEISENSLGYNEKNIKIKKYNLGEARNEKI